MKLLLDTHIWLWSLLEPQRLTKRVVRELASSRNELWLSPISVWELVILCEKGRVCPGEDVTTWVSKMVSAIPLKEAPITHAVALQTQRVQLAHRDPADRFLAATAIVFELTLVTADERLLGAEGISILANR